MTKDQIINSAISSYFSQMKRISFEAITGHLDTLEDKEKERVVRQILSDVYDAAIKEEIAEINKEAETQLQEDIDEYYKEVLSGIEIHKKPKL